MKDFWQKITFAKYVVTLVVALAVQLFAFQVHIADQSRHLDFNEKNILTNIKKDGLYIDTDKSKVEKQLLILEKRIELIEKQLQMYKEEGRLQTPDEKIRLIKNAVRELIKEMK